MDNRFFSCHGCRAVSARHDQIAAGTLSRCLATQPRPVFQAPAQPARPRPRPARNPLPAQLCAKAPLATSPEARYYALAAARRPGSTHRLYPLCGVCILRFSSLNTARADRTPPSRSPNGPGPRRHLPERGTSLNSSTTLCSVSPYRGLAYSICQCSTGWLAA